MTEEKEAAPRAMKLYRIEAQDIVEHSPPCNDCGKVTEPITRDGRPLFKQWDSYIVRDALWSQAGMVGWGGGSLCTPCLSKRLGRDLMPADYLARAVRATSKYLEIEVHPDYFNRPSTMHLTTPVFESRRKIRGEDE
jgi:hypothetical protein